MPEPLIYVSRQKALLFAGFLVLYEFLTYIANDMMMPGMLQVVEAFNAPESAVATSLTAYVLGGASLQIFLGPLSDRYGRRPVMLSGAVIFFVFTLLIAGSQTINQFLLARFFEGMGLCFIGVIGYATLQEIFDEMDAIRLVAIISNVALLAPLLGPLVGAALIHLMGWRAIFALIALLALIALVGLWRYMPEPVGAKTRAGGKIARIPLSPRTVFGNYKALLTDRSFMTGSLASGIISVPCIAWIGLSPLIIMRYGHASMMTYALWQLPVFGAIIVGNFVLHYLSRRFTIRTLILVGSATTIGGLVLGVALPVFISADYRWLMPGIILYSLGLGIANAPLYRHILFATPVSKGTAAALISLFSMTAQGLGVEAASLVYVGHDNRVFALFCALSGLVYAVCLLGVRMKTKGVPPA